MSDREEVSRWMSRAHNDIIVARHSFDDLCPKQLEICCYLCQQAAEKALKAFLLFKEYEFPWTHDLVKLCQLCMDFDNGFDGLLNDCSDLTPYATQARYPNKIEIEETETAAALSKAEKLVGMVTGLICPAEESISQ